MNHSHVLYDSDPHFKIDPISRNIINTSSTKTRLIQHDHNSERFTFEIPRIVEGHDMSSCNLVEIHYANIEANTKIVRGGVYTVDDLQIKSDDDNVVVCSWLIPNRVTQYVGQLQFLIRFACVNESTGKVDYVWNTGVYAGITISSGIYNAESQSDNQVFPYSFLTTVSGDVLKVDTVDTERFNELVESESVLSNCLYILTDDNTLDEIESAIATQNESIKSAIEEQNKTIADSISEFANQSHAKTADKASYLSLLGDDGYCLYAQRIEQGKGNIRLGGKYPSGEMEYDLVSVHSADTVKSTTYKAEDDELYSKINVGTSLGVYDVLYGRYDADGKLLSKRTDRIILSADDLVITGTPPNRTYTITNSYSANYDNSGIYAEYDCSGIESGNGLSATIKVGINTGTTVRKLIWARRIGG